MSHRVRRLDLFVTEACNLACEYCFAATSPRKNPSRDQLLERLDWLMESEARKVHVTFWGGEPLLCRDLLEDLVSHARTRAEAAGKRISFSMPTNASLIDDETMRWLDENRIAVFLSIDGDESGQAARPLRSGQSSHGLVSIGMKAAIRGAKAPPAIRMTVSPANAHAQADGVRYFLENGAKELLVYPAYDQEWSREAVDDFTAGQREMGALFIDLVRDCDTHEDLPVFKAWLPIMRRLWRKTPHRARAGDLPGCGVGRDLVGITVDGQFTPCHRVVFYGRGRGEAVELGNTADGLDAAAALEWSQLRVEDMQGRTRCVECEQFDLCTFGCVAISYATTGRFDRVPRAACDLISAQIEVCREIHTALADDPRYCLYLGQPLDAVLRRTSTSLGTRAWHLFRDSMGARA